MDFTQYIPHVVVFGLGYAAHIGVAKAKTVLMAKLAEIVAKHVTKPPTG